MTKSKTINLTKYYNWPSPEPRGEWWQRDLMDFVGSFPKGKQNSWGIPFNLADGNGPSVILLRKGMPDVVVRLNGKAAFLCFAHEWAQIPDAVKWEAPAEGLVVGEYEIQYADGSRSVLPIRARFEVSMKESPGPVWLAMAFDMWKARNPLEYCAELTWGRTQMGTDYGRWPPVTCAMRNPYPDKNIRALTIRGLQESPLLVAGLTLYNGKFHPQAHLPRRSYRVKLPGKPAKIKKAEVDLGGIARIERTSVPRGKKWLSSPYTGTQGKEGDGGSEDIMEIFGAQDATVSVLAEGAKKKMAFSLGEAFRNGESRSGDARLQVLGKKRQWMRIRAIDDSTGKPTPIRLHISGARGEYIAPYGHHAQINANWFEDYGADVVVGDRNFAYVPGEFTTDMPVGDVYVEMFKGFEYEPIRQKITIKPGQKAVDLRVKRMSDLRRLGWVTADTHVHFISPHTAWLEGQAEGINVVNLLASQWGRLFTNVGDYTGRVGVAEDDTIVYVGTENRNHMLGHISMLGTKGLPVFPMCCGGPTEAWVGDPDFMSLAEWALENKRKGGVVIRPHYPYCGHTEDPVPILKGLVDALEINIRRDNGFPMQEWYRYLNCGYRVAVVGGTDKMGAYTALGWLRTYAKLDPDRPFTYESWAEAVRAGRTVSTSGPLLDLNVEGKGIGETIEMNSSGGTVEVSATAESIWPMSLIEVVFNGKVVGAESAPKGSKQLAVRLRLPVESSGWIAARCWGSEGHPASYAAAHTSPVYIKCGDSRAFDGAAARHILALVEGGVEYLNTLATIFDEPARKRMVKSFNEARKELMRRLATEAGHLRAHDC